MKTITLRSWISEEELNLSSVSDEILDTDGVVYGTDDGGMWWVCPLLVVHSTSVGTSVISEDDEERFRDWLDVDNSRPTDSTKPNEVVYGEV